MTVLKSTLQPVLNDVLSSVLGDDDAATGITGGFTETQVDDSNLTEYTFSAVDFSTASADRIIVATISVAESGGDNVISGVTFGGVSGTFIIEVDNAPAASDESTHIYMANVPTGTTGDIVVSFSAGSPQACAITAYALFGANATPHDTASDVTSTTAASTTIDVEAGGFVIFGATVRSDTDRTATWTLTENADGALQTGVQTYTAASDPFVSAQTGLTVTCTLNAAASRNIPMAGVSFSPS